MEQALHLLDSLTDAKCPAQSICFLRSAGQLAGWIKEASVSDHKAKEEDPACGMTEETGSSLREPKSVVV